MKRRPAACLLMTLALALAASSAWGSLILSKYDPVPKTAPKDPCPSHAGYHCWATAFKLQVISAGTNKGFEDGFKTKLIDAKDDTKTRWDPTGWTLTAGDALTLDGKDFLVTVTKYGAYNDCPGSEGAEIKLSLPAGAPEGLKWVQVVNTNRPSSRNKDTPEWYLDVLLPGEQPAGDPDPPGVAPEYPFTYEDRSFYDRPGRNCEPDKHIYWAGYLYLAEIDSTNKTVTYHDGIFWGFTIDCVPEPGTLVIFGVLFGCGYVGRIVIVCRRRASSR